jgi:hypothetical protein
MRVFSVVALLAHTSADIKCGGCDPLSGDHARPICDCCGGVAVLVVPCSAGWRSLNGAHHSVSWCALCWQQLQAVRKRTAPPLVAIALTIQGEALLRRPAVQQEPHKRPPRVRCQVA